MSPFLNVLTLAIVMGLTSYAAAILPLKVNIPQHRMIYFSCFSLGVLVGTVLCLVIPEGAGAVMVAVKHIQDYDVLSCIGISLLAGFALMFLIDNFLSLAPDSHVDLPEVSYKPKLKSLATSTLTLGLLLHSLVDGIALGTSYLNDKGSFELLFFFVIIVHKLPTAASFSVMLLQEGILPDICLFHALVFSLTTPVVSILTYIIAQIFGFNDQFTVGILLLFSAGTFLYSVMHVMMEIGKRSTDGAHEGHNPSFSGTELALVIFGMSVPVVFSQFGE